MFICLFTFFFFVVYLFHSTRSVLNLSLGLLFMSIYVLLSYFVFLDKFFGLVVGLIFTGGVMVLLLFMVSLDEHRSLVYDKVGFLWGFVVFLAGPSCVVNLGSGMISFSTFYAGADCFNIFLVCFSLLLTLFTSVKLCSTLKGSMLSK